jgi:hypothetical protein
VTALAPHSRLQRLGRPWEPLLAIFAAGFLEEGATSSIACSVATAHVDNDIRVAGADPDRND